jgi:hypothetical protein
MKIVELINSKIQLPITNEEAEVLDKFTEGQSIARRELNEREVYIANQLVNKDVLTRRNNNGQISYFKKIKD